MRPAGRTLDPSPPDISDEGGRGGWRWLVTASGIVDAELIKGFLETSGVVPVAFDSRDPSPGAWMFPAGDSNAPVRIFVLASRWEDARIALLELGVSSDPAFAVDEQIDADLDDLEPQDRRSWVKQAIFRVAAAAMLLAMILNAIRSSL